MIRTYHSSLCSSAKRELCISRSNTLTHITNFKFRYERKKSADVILLSSIRSVHRYESDDGMMKSSLVLTHECPRNDGRLVMYEFKAAPGMKALDHTVAWQVSAELFHSSYLERWNAVSRSRRSCGF